jgi:hypothetical protein
MSTYSLMTRHAAREYEVRRRPSLRDAGGSQPPDVVGLLADRIPAEAIALYTGVLAFLVPDDTPVDAQSYGGRWLLAAAVSAIAVLYAAGIYYRAVRAQSEEFHWPWANMAIVFVAFWAWVAVIPGSPFNDIESYTPTLGAAIGLVINGLLGALALFFEDPA